MVTTRTGPLVEQLATAVTSDLDEARRHIEAGLQIVQKLGEDVGPVNAGLSQLIRSKTREISLAFEAMAEGGEDHSAKLRGALLPPIVQRVDSDRLGRLLTAGAAP